MTPLPVSSMVGADSLARTGGFNSDHPAVGGTFGMDRRSFDGDRQRFWERPQRVSSAQLLFIRWPVERGRLQHPSANIPGGALAEPTTAETSPSAGAG